MGQLANALNTRLVGERPSDTHVPRVENQEHKAIILHSSKDLRVPQPSTTLKVQGKEKEDNTALENEDGRVNVEVLEEEEDPKPQPPKPYAPRIPYPQKRNLNNFWRYLKN